MHDTAHEHARLFFDCYWQPDFTTVAELGSYDVNGRLRDHAPPGVRYIGMDMEPGPGVDLVVAPGQPLPLADASIDVAVTSSCFEHDIAFWDSFLELVRILRPGGLLYLNAPSNYAVHRYPLDCWRFYPDAGLALCQWAARQGVAVDLAESFIGQQGGEGWCDFVAVFRKAGPGTLRRRGRIAGQAPAANILDGGAGGAPVREAERGQTDEMLAIAGLRASLAERDAALAVRQADHDAQAATLAARDAELTRQAASLAALQAEAAERAAAQEALAARCAAQARALADCEASLAEAGASATALAARLAEAEAALATAESHLRRVLGSRSWQLTAPLRAVLQRVHRG
ncbi:methyltransferase domain-containing protein [Dankookia rubra]|uniref:Methyltransferase domain-containing protein n=1 Tax=Dankookia rubra TaxID=1442381 RepID=A0A4R5QKX7_9PROT|nr:methyltransferase domain-containing protein [Dankookia rubra]TDH64140.1 methyltransferase domain-containing protein [Dankookia rubra]